MNVNNHLESWYIKQKPELFVSIELVDRARRLGSIILSIFFSEKIQSAHAPFVVGLANLWDWQDSPDALWSFPFFAVQPLADTRERDGSSVDNFLAGLGISGLLHIADRWWKVHFHVALVDADGSFRSCFFYLKWIGLLTYEVTLRINQSK